MDPILPLGIDRAGWADRLANIRDYLSVGGTQTPSAPSAPTPLGIQTVSTLDISSSVHRLLQSLGGGAESNKMLEMMLTLLILLSLLEQQRSGEPESSPLGKLTDQLSGISWCSISYSSTTVSTQWTSISLDQFQSVQSGVSDAAGAQAHSFDIIA